MIVNYTEGAPGPSLLGTGDIDTMQAPISTRTLDARMTLPAACFFSGASGHRSISTGKERDSESGNDYFGARYYSSNMGRFMSPDWSAKEDPVPYANLDDPQTLNLYSYVQNNPLARVDVDGHAAGVDDAIEGIVVLAVVGTIALEAGAQAYNNSPEGQRGIQTFTNAVSDSFSSSISSIKNTLSSVFSKKATPPPAETDGKATGPVKAADAPGVTAGGQATNEHGQKIAPSGRPQINNVNKGTREAAKNAGNKGSGTVEDKTSKRGGPPHFHTKRGDGTRVKDGTHYNYPRR